ncbi:MAG: sugar O-acetyltransferase [Devosia sp.]
MDPDWLRHVKAGEPFAMVDPEFLEAVFAARAKMAGYPAAMAVGFEAMQAALAELLGSVGRDVVIVPPFAVDVGFNIEVGDGTFINVNCTLLDTYPIHIGKHVMVGPNCAFYPVGHPMRAADRITRDGNGKPTGHITSGAPIVIEDEVWIGGNVVVTQGVTIGARSMIGAGSVVTKSIPPDVFAAGNPCKVIRAL